jgi:hypothetical protein
MITIGILLMVLAGICEHFKDLSEEGKLSGYWDKNDPAKFLTITERKMWLHFSHFEKGKQQWIIEYWWDVHRLQGPFWDKIPRGIRKYLSFRDGWHLLKFGSLNLFAVGIVILFSVNWWWFFVLRFAFSLPETIFRKYLK